VESTRKGRRGREEVKGKKEKIRIEAKFVKKKIGGASKKGFWFSAQKKAKEGNGTRKDYSVVSGARKKISCRKELGWGKKKESAKTRKKN